MVRSSRPCNLKVRIFATLACCLCIVALSFCHFHQICVNNCIKDHFHRLTSLSLSSLYWSSSILYSASRLLKRDLNALKWYETCYGGFGCFDFKFVCSGITCMDTSKTGDMRPGTKAWVTPLLQLNRSHPTHLSFFGAVTLWFIKYI